MSLLGKHAVMEQFLAEGVRYVFGNPGSTELAFMDGLQDYPDLLAAMQDVGSGGALNQDLYYRLYGAGLVRKEGDRVNPANMLYNGFFKKVL